MKSGFYRGFCVLFCSVPRPEDLEDEAIQQQPKASYESVSETQQPHAQSQPRASPDKSPIPLPEKEPIAVEVSEEDLIEINSSS